MGFFSIDNSNDGSGNWSIGGLKLPELGISEVFGGKTGSIGNNTSNNGYGSLYTSVLPTVADYVSGPDFTTGSGYNYDAGQVAGTQESPTTQNGGGTPTITDNFNINGADLQTTSDGNVTGLGDLKKTQGYLDYYKKYGGTGQDYLNWLNSGGAEQDAINDSYDEGMSFLDQQEQSLLGNQGDFFNTFTKPFEAMFPLIQQAVDQGQAGIENAKGIANQNAQSALDAARNLFNELAQRNQGIWGSGALSSAGQAASELLAREGARQFGSIRQGATDAINQLVQKGLDLKSQAEAKLQSLELQKQQALSEAKLAFREKLDEINAKRFELGQNKAQAKLAALQDFRNTVQTIQQQAVAFGQQLQAMKVQADLNLRNALATTQGYTSDALQGATNVVGNFNNAAQAGQAEMAAGNSISAGGGGGQGFGSPLAGYFGNFSLGGNDDENNPFSA